MPKSLSFKINGNSMNPTFNDGDSIEVLKFHNTDNINVDDIVVFYHPFKSNFKMLKRVKQITTKGDLFVEGDNPDLGNSEDSHNFGLINRKLVVGIKQKGN